MAPRPLRTDPAQRGERPRHQALVIAMDTLIQVEVASSRPAPEVVPGMQRALRWFGRVEQSCSRFDPNSELRRLLDQVGQPAPASPVLFEAVRFAMALARQSGGAFDPTVGLALEARGFDRDYRTGQRVRSTVAVSRTVSYRDVRLDPARRTITLRQPLLLDLGAVAKGLAIDLAARELAEFDSFCIDAGGDLFVRGRTADGERWRIGVQDPRASDRLAFRLAVADQAVCTSGDYERRTIDGAEHHLIDPRSGHSADALASVTVVAPTALAADGLATAAFVLGPQRGLRLLEAQGVEGVLIAPDGTLRTTRRLREAGP